MEKSLVNRLRDISSAVNSSSHPNSHANENASLFVTYPLFANWIWYGDEFPIRESQMYSFWTLCHASMSTYPLKI